MQNINQLNRICSYLIEAEIGRIESDLPDVPSDNPEYTWIPDYGEGFVRKFREIKKRTESIETLHKKRVVILGDISLNKPGYYSYVTNRMHEFAENWLKDDDEVNKGRAKKTFRANDEDEYWNDRIMEKVLDDLQLETWKELVAIISSFKNYCFKTTVFYSPDLEDYEPH